MRQLVLAMGLSGLLGLLGLAASCSSPPRLLPDAGWVERVAALVQEWPVSTYNVLDKGRAVGRMTLRQSLVMHEGELFVQLEDAARVDDPTGEAASVDYAYSARCLLDPHLTPVLIEAQAPVREDTPTWSRIEVQGGRAVGHTFEATVDMKVPDQFAIRQGLMRLVGLLPREVGTETRLSLLSLGARPRVDKGRAVRCSGREELILAGRRVMAWRFEYVAGKEGEQHTVALWVGDDGRFLRFHDPQGLQLELRDAS